MKINKVTVGTFPVSLTYKTNLGTFTLRAMFKHVLAFSLLNVFIADFTQNVATRWNSYAISFVYSNQHYLLAIADCFVVERFIHRPVMVEFYLHYRVLILTFLHSVNGFGRLIRYCHDKTKTTCCCIALWSDDWSNPIQG